MSFYVESNQERQFKNVPAGSHLGRCYRIVDLGSQKVEYMGETKVQRKIMLSWELFQELHTLLERKRQLTQGPTVLEE